MTDKELKPCPFCGSEANIASVKYSPESDTAKLNNRTTGYYGQCIRCAANLCFDIAEPTKAEAITAWNHRQPDTELVDALKTALGLLKLIGCPDCNGSGTITLDGGENGLDEEQCVICCEVGEIKLALAKYKEKE